MLLKGEGQEIKRGIQALTGEIKEEMCGKDNCELCQLLNEFLSEPRIKNEFSLITRRYEKYGKLFYH